MSEQQQQQQQAPWHQGVDAAILGHWQNKAFDLSDPVKVAVEATKGAIEAGKFIGAPPERLIRLPDKQDDAAGWGNVWSRLGKPDKPDGYDLSTVKLNGADLEASFSDAMRGALHKANVAKEAGPEVVKSVVKWLEDADKAETEAKTAKLTTEKADLAKLWGPKAEENRLTAMQGARRAAGSDDAGKALVDAMEQAIGYKATMEFFRKIGAGTKEDTFVEDSHGGHGNPVTSAAAQARLTELQNDQAWQKRLLGNDAQAVSEFNNLTTIIANAA